MSIDEARRQAREGERFSVPHGTGPTGRDLNEPVVQVAQHFRKAIDALAQSIDELQGEVEDLRRQKRRPGLVGERQDACWRRTDPIRRPPGEAFQDSR